MKIIIRSCGERTEQRCISLAKKHGKPHLINAFPFGETLRQSYEMAIGWDQDFVPMVDADVLLHPGTIKFAVNKLKTLPKNVFCWDGNTNDKVMIKKRRAGIHIYRRDLLSQAMQYIEDNQLKPESHVRREMQKNHDAITHSEGFVFGMHDFEQFYRDLWRKSFAQSRKLAGMIRRNPAIIKRWSRLSLRDNDYKVILAAHKQGRTYRGDIIIDARQNYGASNGLKRLGLKEKGRLV